MGNQLDTGGVSGAAGQDKPPSVWVRAATTVSTLWPIPWPMATGILLILLVGWLVPLVPDALHGVGQGIAVAWNWLRLTGDGSPAAVTNAETVRNVSLTLGGPLAVVALWLAWRRTFDARRQTNTQIEQSNTQIKQSNTAERARQSERFEVAVQNLVSGKTAAEITAVETLDQLRREDPDIFEGSVVRMLADCVSNTNLSGNISTEKERFGTNSAVEERVWDILLNRYIVSNNMVFDRVKIREAVCNAPLISIDNCVSTEFIGVYFGDIFIKSRIYRVSFQRCSIRHLVIFEEEIEFTIDFGSIFDNCRIGEIEYYGEEPMSEKIFDNLFYNCEDFSGESIVHPITMKKN